MFLGLLLWEIFDRHGIELEWWEILLLILLTVP